MNVLHITSAKTWRGGERQVQYLVEGLRKKGHNNFLMAPQNSPLVSNISNAINATTHFNRGLFSRIKNIWNLNQICAKHEIEIIHGHDSHAHSLLWMSSVLINLKTKSIVSRRLNNPIRNNSLSKYNHPIISKIICISNAVAKTIAPQINKPSRIEVVHSGIDLQTISVEPRSIENQKKFNIGYVASFHPEKDHFTFLNAINSLNTSFPNLQINGVLYGAGPTIDRIKTKSQTLPILIEFKGFTEDIQSAYNEIDILLHTSKSEALGTSILDAMKYGIPVVATNTGGIPELIEPGINGYLCENNDSESMSLFLYKILTNETLYKSFSQNNLQKVQSFSKEAMVDNTLRVYKSILD